MRYSQPGEEVLCRAVVVVRLYAEVEGAAGDGVVEGRHMAALEVLAIMQKEKGNKMKCLAAYQLGALLDHGNGLAKVLLEADSGVGTAGAGTDNGDIDNALRRGDAGRQRRRRGGKSKRCCGQQCAGDLYDSHGKNEMLMSDKGKIANEWTQLSNCNCRKQHAG